MKRWVWLVLLAVGLAGCSSAAASTTPGVPGVGGVSCSDTGTAVPGLDTEQAGNAKAIIAVAYSLGLGEAGAKVGVAAAMTESSLRAVNFGDHNSDGSMTTSRGLFQMKDAWGPLADRLDPTKAATIFYTVNNGPGVTGLMHIPGWQNMPIPQAAQAVEQSGTSDGSNYAPNVQVALDAVAALGPGCHAQTSPLGKAPIPGGLNPSQDPTTFGWVRAGPMEPLVWQGHRFGQVAAGTAGLWTAMLNELVPTIPGGLDSNLGCFEDRQNVNNPSVASFHAYGLACDLNSGVNSNGTSAQSLQGRTGALPMSTSAVAAKYGMEWGGDFTGTPDPMHLEVHLSPQQVAASGSGSSVSVI